MMTREITPGSSVITSLEMNMQNVIEDDTDTELVINFAEKQRQLSTQRSREHNRKDNNKKTGSYTRYQNRDSQ